MERYTPEEAMIEAEKLSQKISADEATDFHDAEVKLTDAEAKLGKEFLAQLDKILNVPLSPENIDSYANDAINQVVVLADKIVSQYSKEGPRGVSKLEFEDFAFKHYGLTGINETLDYIIQKEKDIKHIDDVISKAIKIDSLIVPPKNQEAEIVAGEKSFKEKLTVARTKTILFILANDFDVDVDDQEQVNLTTGVLTDSMVRKLSYAMIEIPKLDRLILCCDEEENATYVFGIMELDKNGMTVENLSKLNKNELDNLIEANPNSGRKIRYSNKYVWNVSHQLVKIEPYVKKKRYSDKKETEGVSYLYPKAPEGYQTKLGLSREFGIAFGAVENAIIDLGDDLGQVKSYRFGFKQAVGYSPEQQIKIRMKLEERGQFNEKATQEILSTFGLANKFKISYAIVKQVIEDIKDSLGEVGSYKFVSSSGDGYTPEQQKLIQDELEKRGYFTPKAPADVLSAKKLFRLWGIDRESIQAVIDGLVEELGAVDQYRFGSMRVPGYTPEQQVIIKRKLEEKGLFEEKAPTNVLSADGMSKKWGIGYRKVTDAIADLRKELGNLKRYRFGSSAVIGYTPEQQKMILEKLTSTMKMRHERNL